MIMCAWIGCSLTLMRTPAGVSAEGEGAASLPVTATLLSHMIQLSHQLI